MANIIHLRTSGTNNAVPVARDPRGTHRRYSAVVSRTLKKLGFASHDGRVSALLEAIAYEGDEGIRDDANADWSECRCRLHQWVKCGDEDVEGCGAEKHGTHPAIYGLYTAGHRACLVEPGVRELDRQVFQLAEYGELVARPGRGRGKFPDPRKRYMKGYGTSPERMGAWYCYTRLFPESFVVRIGRLLGPRPEKLRVIRYALIFGKPEVDGFLLSELSCGDLHITAGGAQKVNLVDALWEVFCTGGVGARVGTDPTEHVGNIDAPSTDFVRESIKKWVRAAPEAMEEEGAECTVKWYGANVVPRITLSALGVDEEARWERLSTCLRAHGVEIGEHAKVPLLLATRAQAFAPASLSGARERHRVWQLHGDAVLRCAITRRACEVEADVADVVEVYRNVENKALCRVFYEAGFDGCCVATGLLRESKAVADVVEALVGVVDLYCGAASIEALLQRFVLRGALGTFIVRPPVLARGAGEGLNSQQLKVALRLAAHGLLDVNI